MRDSLESSPSNPKSSMPSLKDEGTSEAGTTETAKRTIQSTGDQFEDKSRSERPPRTPKDELAEGVLRLKDNKIWGKSAIISWGGQSTRP
jgi:hypothetical protein